jgi:hypothetical protein
LLLFNGERLCFVLRGIPNGDTHHFEGKRPVNPILNLGEQKPEIGAWKTIQSEECGYGVVEKR